MHVNCRLTIYLLFSFLVLLLAISCSDERDAHQQFLNNYSDYCGYAYEGHSVMVDIYEGHPLEGAELLMILNECSDTEVRIPFHVNEDRSRTWILKLTEQGLHLSHDHRHEDGTQYDHNFYGGYAENSGSAVKQVFPADHTTIEDRPEREINVWSKEFDRENEKYYYRLYLDGELSYEAEFDLSNPFNI